MPNCQMFLILWWESVEASISCVHCFDLSLGYLSTFYHLGTVWSVRGIILNHVLLFFFFFSFFLLGLKICPSPFQNPQNSHVVYCRLTKGREVKTVTPVTWMRCHNTTAGTHEKFQSSKSVCEIKRARHREEKNKEK